MTNLVFPEVIPCRQSDIAILPYLTILQQEYLLALALLWSTS
jgi:hypothetical protein